MQTNKILIVGLGNMGGAIAHQLIAAGNRVYGVNPSPKNIQGLIRQFNNHQEITENFDAIIYAIKPQKFEEITPYSSIDALHISVMAGVNIGKISSLLGTRVIRAMPNLPVAIGEGITPLFANAQIAERDKNLALEIFSALGMSFFCEAEEQIDFLTAISGSGPAYIFLIQEILQELLIYQGFKQDISRQIISQLFTGSAIFSEISEKKFFELRENVTSPNGTTHAALQYLMHEENGLKPIFAKAIQAAFERAKELGK